MILQRQRLFLLLVISGIFFSACTKQWDEHTAIIDPEASETLLEKINGDPELSKFSEFLEKTGYDKLIASSKSFTVWAPTNDAISKVEAAAIGTDDKLKLFVGNHIADLAFQTTQLRAEYVRIKTLNGKNVTFSAKDVDGASILKADVYVGNGILHTIGAAIMPKVSAWEYLISTNTLQKQALQSFDYSYIDFNTAEEIGVNPTTGKPIYKEGTGIVQANRFLNRNFPDRLNGVMQVNATDISDENGLFTYIVLTDEAFLAEKARLSRFYALGSQDSTDSLTRFSIVKDLAFRGILNSNNFPGTAFSIGDSVKFHLNKADVVETHQVSNGVVYVMKNINYDLTGTGEQFDRYTKIKPVLIEGESASNSTDFLSVKTNSRPTRRSPDGTLYTQLLVQNHGTNTYWARYRPDVVNSVKYKVYWRVVRDYNLVPAAGATDLVYSKMRIAFKSVNPVVPPFNYVEKPGVIKNGSQFLPDYTDYYLGEFTPDKYYSKTLKSGIEGALSVFLVGNNVTTNGQTDLLLDYIKLVPVP
ncbi:MAG: fasciclin domain-containing protein [Arcticibacter sp.]